MSNCNFGLSERCELDEYALTLFMHDLDGSYLLDCWIIRTKNGGNCV